MQKSPHFRLVLAGDTGIFLRAEGRDSRSTSSASHSFGTFPARGRLFAADGGVCYMGIKWRMRGSFLFVSGVVMSESLYSGRYCRTEQKGFWENSKESGFVV